MFEFGRVNGMDPNVIRALAKKYHFKVTWKFRGNKNVGFSPLDYDARFSQVLVKPSQTHILYLIRFWVAMLSLVWGIRIFTQKR